MWTSLLFLGSLFVPTAQEPPSRDQDLQALLADAVDRPTPRERRSAADELASLREVSVEAWLEAAASFQPRPAEAIPTPGAHGPGAHAARVPLMIGDEATTVDIDWWVPSGYDHAAPAPLLVILHGTGGSGRGQDRPWQRIAEELGMLLLMPSDVGQNIGYGFTEEERLAALASLRWMRRHFNVDEDRVHLTGVSRGGHMSWDLAMRYPDCFASMAPMIGGPRVQTRAGQNNLRFLENLLQTPIRDLQGSRDDPGLLFNLRYAFDVLKELEHPDAELIEFADLGHSYRMDPVDWVRFLGEARRTPRPERWVRRVAAPDQAPIGGLLIERLGKTVEEEVQLRVDPRKWNALGPEEQKLELQSQVDERTARIEVERLRVGSYRARVEHVTRATLLLTLDEIDPKKATEFRLGSKRTRKKLQPSARVLLRNFVERFDRSFLPVAELTAG